MCVLMAEKMEFLQFSREKRFCLVYVINIGFPPFSIISSSLFHFFFQPLSDPIFQFYCFQHVQCNSFFKKTKK